MFNTSDIIVLVAITIVLAAFAADILIKEYRMVKWEKEMKALHVRRAADAVYAAYTNEAWGEGNN